MRKSAPLLMQGFSHFLGLFQVIMANLDEITQWHFLSDRLGHIQRDDFAFIALTKGRTWRMGSQVVNW